MYRKTAKKLLKFIEKSPTAFQAVTEMTKRLDKEGFEELKEEDHWKLKKGGNYYVTRNHSAIIAFSIPQKPVWKFHIMASHSDSPSLKIKENPEIEVENAYIKLNVERYGGMILSPWFDRPLSVAGRLIVRQDEKIREKMVTVDRDLLVIPNLAIHMNREVNDGYKYNVQKDMLPLFSDKEGKGRFMEAVAEAAEVKTEDILGHDLFLYDRTPGTLWGVNEEFVSAPRLDDLQCAFSSMEGFLQGNREESISVHCVLDNEEVGSSTRQGAASTFLKDTLMRINMGLGRTQEEYYMALADSFMISADNAHALHPNYTDKTDPVNRPVLNGGIVIKYNANQKYCTDGVSAAIFKDMCDRAKLAKLYIPNQYVQPYAIFNEDMKYDYEQRSLALIQLDDAIKNSEIKVFYQPIYDAKTKQIASAEALVRWVSPKGVILPGKFIPALEESGHITKLDTYVHKSVRRFMENRYKNGKKIVRVAVNLSRMDLMDDEIMDLIIDDVKDEHYSKQMVNYEVTESAYADVSGKGTNFLMQLHDNGVKLLIDDFGSGMSSFSTLRDYDFDIIKLDMGFVQKLGENKKYNNIVMSIIELAHRLDMKVVAEGVETKEQADCLKEYGCDYLQGFYFSKPLPEEEFAKLLD